MKGNLWKFSNQLDDEDILFAQREFITLSDGAEYYGMSLKVFTCLCRRAGAVYKVGKMVRVSRLILEQYLRETKCLSAKGEN